MTAADNRGDERPIIYVDPDGIRWPALTPEQMDTVVAILRPAMPVVPLAPRRRSARRLRDNDGGERRATAS